LQHADFLAPRLDVQAHGVADHQQRAEAEQRRQHQHRAATETQPRVQPLAPQRVVLHNPVSASVPAPAPKSRVARG
jgi:hypothetical protein